MQNIVEVIADYTDEDNYTHIDAYFDTDPDSEGRTVAIVCNDTKKVYFIDNGVRNDPKVKEAINELLTKTEETETLEENLIDTVIEEIKSDILVGDLTAIFALLTFVPVKNLISFLPEEKWEAYNSLK